MKKIVLAIICLTVLATSASASTPPTYSLTTMQVVATVLPLVQVSASTINFGTLVAGDSSVVMSSILITAPQGTPLLSIDLDRGLNFWDTSRRMVGPNLEYLPYQVYQDANLSQPWGDGTAGTNNMPSLQLNGVQGTGHTMQFDVYAKLQTNTDTLAGDYCDTITVQVNY